MLLNRIQKLCTGAFVYLKGPLALQKTRAPRIAQRCGLWFGPLSSSRSQNSLRYSTGTPWFATKCALAYHDSYNAQICLKKPVESQGIPSPKAVDILVYVSAYDLALFFSFANCMAVSWPSCHSFSGRDVNPRCLLMPCPAMIRDRNARVLLYVCCIAEMLSALLLQPANCFNFAISDGPAAFGGRGGGLELNARNAYRDPIRLQTHVFI